MPNSGTVWPRRVLQLHVSILRPPLQPISLGSERQAVVRKGSSNSESQADRHSYHTNTPSWRGYHPALPDGSDGTQCKPSLQKTIDDGTWTQHCRSRFDKDMQTY